MSETGDGASGRSAAVALPPEAAAAEREDFARGLAIIAALAETLPPLRGSVTLPIPPVSTGPDAA